MSVSLVRLLIFIVLALVAILLGGFVGGFFDQSNSTTQPTQALTQPTE